jgi:hypothetical protein
LLFLTRVLLAQEPTPILPDANMTPGDTFDVTAQDICAHGYVRKVRDVIGSQGRATMAKPNRANTCPKKKQSRRAIDRRTVRENDFMELNRNWLTSSKAVRSSPSPASKAIWYYIDDESTLKLRVASQATVRVGAKVDAVHEAGEHFQVDLEEGPSVQVQLADPGSSVALRDKSGAVQYLG